MPGIFSFIRDIVNDSREILLLSDTHGYTLTGFELATPSQLHLQLPEVWAPAQYLIEAGLRPALARRLSSTYMDFVARYRKTCQLHFDRATHGGSHLTEYCREVFIILFKRAVQAWSSQIVSIVRVQLRQAGALQVTISPERVNIRVDDAAKAEIIARLGFQATQFTSNRVVSPSADVASRREEVSEQKRALSTVSHLRLSEWSPVSPTEVTSRPLDPFCQPAPATCFPAPYPPPPEHSSSLSPQRTLATSFVPPVPPQNVRPLASYSPDVSSMTDLFGRMTVTTLKTDSTNPKCHRMFGISDFNKLTPVPSPTTASCSRESHLASMELIASPPKSTVRRRKIAALPTRRGKTSVSISPPVLDPAGATSYLIPRPYERVAEKTFPDHIPTSPPQKPRLVSAPLPPYTAETLCFATPKISTPRQRKVHSLRKTLPQSQTIPQNQGSKPLAMAGETFSPNASRSPPLVSDATSYFDSPPTSSDELDTPPSTPPSSHVLLAHSSTESLAISESVGIVSHKEPLRDAKLPNPRQRYRRLDFTKGSLVRNEQPLTFTFSV